MALCDQLAITIARFIVNDQGLVTFISEIKQLADQAEDQEIQRLINEEKHSP